VQPALELPQQGLKDLIAGIGVSVAIIGEIQLTNSALALAALQILQQQGWEISEHAIATAWQKTNGLGVFNGKPGKTTRY